MRIVTIALLKAAVVLVLLLVLTDCAQAGGRRPWLRRHEHAGHHAMHHAPIDSREWYPKYYGGFHSRALQNLGVPTGDIGLRGNGFMMNPWYAADLCRLSLRERTPFRGAKGDNSKKIRSAAQHLPACAH